MNKNVAVLFGNPSQESALDEYDTLIEVENVCNALQSLGLKPVKITVELDLQSVIKKIEAANPLFAFNLVESIEGKGKWCHLAAALLECMDIPFSGSGSSAIYLTSNKIKTKKKLQKHNIATPAWQNLTDLDSGAPVIDFPFIIKLKQEDASIDITDSSVIFNHESLRKKLSCIVREKWNDYFLEKYVDGREFNISLLEEDRKITVLPAAEIEFNGFPENKPKIVNYDAKWNPHSFEYHNTVRKFEFNKDDDALLKQLQDISNKCWRLFGLRGYARIDFRIDCYGNPWVLEINANPCISPDSGFVAAAQKAGYTNYTNLINQIIKSALKDDII